MQQCSHCGASNREGVIYCEKCGIAITVIPLTTRQLGDAGMSSGTSQLGDEGAVILQVENFDTPITIQLRQEVILGRLADQGDGKTYVNLTSFNADQMGVSRRHARLLRDRRSVYLMDLNSTNGTRLNGQPLPNAIERRLRDGDVIDLGKLKIYVYFKDAEPYATEEA
jgi:pSer/pThr/pTyr-binding forkhead associated (FHA) protein